MTKKGFFVDDDKIWLLKSDFESCCLMFCFLVAEDFVAYFDCLRLTAVKSGCEWLKAVGRGWKLAQKRSPQNC